MVRRKLEHGLVFWSEPLVKSNGGKRLRRQAMPKCQQPPHSHTETKRHRYSPLQECVGMCIGGISAIVYVCCHFINKTNKSLNIHESAIAQLICCCCSASMLQCYPSIYWIRLLLLGLFSSCYCGGTWHRGISNLTAFANTGRSDHGDFQLRQCGLLAPNSTRGHLIAIPEFSKLLDLVRSFFFCNLNFCFHGRCISVGVGFLRFNYPIVIVVSFQCQNKRKKCV